jgi:Flp pilus assembly protein TadG
MLLLLLGTVDLGRMFFDYIELRNAVREGAAYAARYPSDAAGARQRVFDHVDADLAAAMTVPNPTCSGNFTDLDATGTVTVKARRTFTPVTTAPGWHGNWGSTSSRRAGGTAAGAGAGPRAAGEPR